jgi:hypothetical protein
MTVIAGMALIGARGITTTLTGATVRTGAITVITGVIAAITDTAATGVTGGLTAILGIAGMTVVMGIGDRTNPGRDAAELGFGRPRGQLYMSETAPSSSAIRLI